MDGYGASTYGDRFADVYDDWHGDGFETGDPIPRLSVLAGDGPVLELGVGTGRLAIPLAAATDRSATDDGEPVEIHGLDTSAAMLERLRAREGGGRVTAILGDMAGPLPDGPYALVFVAFNTFFALPSAEAQTAAMVEIARVLRPGGSFALEAFVPAPPGERTSQVELRRLSADRVVLSVHRADPGSQRAEGSYVELSESGGVRLRPWSIRYTAPEELDSMAAIAGLQLASRHADWQGTPFDEHSSHHVSVYHRAV